MISATKLPQIQSHLSAHSPSLPSVAANRQPSIERNNAANNAQSAPEKAAGKPFDLKEMLKPLMDILSSVMSMIGQAFSVAKNLTGMLS